MKKSLLIITIISVVFQFTGLFAGNVSKKNAEKAARNFYYERINRHKDVKPESVQVLDVTVSTKGSQPMFYVVNMAGGGFVLVAADDACYPVLGYSYEGSFDLENLNESVKAWMNSYSEGIRQIRNEKHEPGIDISSMWTRLLSDNPSDLVIEKGTKDVAPMLLSIWNQDAPYNELCPADPASPAGYNGRVPVGCVATSMAQIIYYYRYPAQGVGSHSYYHDTYGVQSANFGATTYDYSQMLNNNSVSNLALATLNYHCGVAVEMYYGPDGSAADTYAACLAMINRFKYSSQAHYYLKDGHQYTGTWADLLKGSLDQNKLIIYSGYSNADGGHAWVCDGYEGTDHFHFNWGWEGSSNGYYYIGALNPGGSNFNSGNGAVINLYPGSNYPYTCNGTKTLTCINGSFEDGSGPSDYQNNADCQWLIAPVDSVKKITLNFPAFNLSDTSDKIIVYDGNTTDAPVLATLTGELLPNAVSSTGSRMLVRFISNGSGTSAGWQASYSGTPFIYCSGLTNLTDPSGTLSDGSGSKNYSNNSLCRWFIKPTGARSITFSFGSIDTEPGVDTILFRDAKNGMNIATVSGNTLPSPIYCSSGQLLITFRTSGSNTYEGWEGTYTAEVGINENEYMDKLEVYPNPATHLINVTFELSNTQDMQVSLTDMTGKTVYKENFPRLTGLFSQDIDVSGFERGVYFLRLLSSEGNMNQKIILQ